MLLDLVNKFAAARLSNDANQSAWLIGEVAKSWPGVAKLMQVVEAGYGNPQDINPASLPQSIAHPLFARITRVLRLDCEFQQGLRQQVVLKDDQGGQKSFDRQDWNTSPDLLGTRIQGYLLMGMADPLAQTLEILAESDHHAQIPNFIPADLGRSILGLLTASHPQILAQAGKILFSPTVSPQANLQGKLQLKRAVDQWLEEVSGEALDQRIGFLNSKLLTLADGTQLTPETAHQIVAFFGKTSDLSHVGQALMDRLQQMHPDDASVQFWYQRSQVANTLDKQIQPLLRVWRGTMEQQQTLSLATRSAYHAPFAGISRAEEAELLGHLAQTLPAPRKSFAYPKPVEAPIKVAFVSSHTANHGISHVLHQCVGHLGEAGIEYAVVNYGLVKDEDVYQRQIFKHAAQVLTIETSNIHLDFSDLSDEKIVQAQSFVTDYDADALIYLDGFMDLQLLTLLAQRPSPLNLYWIGHGGNLGLDFIDYIISDSFVADPENRDFGLEREIRLPSTFVTSGPFDFDRTMTKADFGFDEDCILINAFNSHIKVDETFLDAVSQVLDALPKAIIWFNNASQSATVWRISRYLESKGIDESRFRFADRLNPKAAHYSRLHVSDFAMDTFHVNMASGALDNMWAELPVVTLPGETFYNRICGSFNKAIGLEQLNAFSFDDYVEKAIKLGSNQDRLATIRAHLREHKGQTSMFDGQKFALELAAGLRAAVERSRQGQAPKTMEIPPVFANIPELT